ncbi:hypothetical protein KUTeg_011446 [Tegillarca granosa]|uniref:Tripartite motif-containing protein 2 n=1 Tax=Tegillarca granosa TaxID=220873 RepID=A0ABQ9F0S1_TEGGR|nr:hypothetical protein KUTeg_011446 [Tegillarca granosa]
MAKLEQRLKEEMSNLNQLIQQCESKRIERNIEMVQFVTDVMQQVDKYTLSEQLDDVSPPKLITRDVYDQKLNNLFGHLDIRTKSDFNHPLQLNRNIEPAISAINAKIISSFSTINSRVVTTGNDQAWLWRFGFSGISLITSDGEVIQNIHTEFRIGDAAVCTSGDLLVTKWAGNIVKKIIRDISIKDIYTARDNYETRGITATDTGNILVVLHNYKDSKILEITTSGQYIRTLLHNLADIIQLFEDPRFICTNINDGIIVTDKGKVVAVNKQGQRRFIYHTGWRQHKKSFIPHYLVTDKHGHIIISDFDNSVLHVLDRDGKFTQYLMTPEQGCDLPVGLDLDNHGRLWMCNYGKQEIDKHSTTFCDHWRLPITFIFWGDQQTKLRYGNHYLKYKMMTCNSHDLKKAYKIQKRRNRHYKDV